MLRTRMNEDAPLYGIVLSSELKGLYKDDEIVMVKIDSRQKFSDIDFSEYHTYKSTKNQSYV